MSKPREKHQKPDRLISVGATLVDILRGYRAADEAERRELCARLSIAFQNNLGPTERGVILTAITAADPEAFEELALSSVYVTVSRGLQPPA